MSTPFNAAAARLISDQAGGKLTAPAASPSGADFGQMLADQLSGIVETGQRSDQVSVDMINGKANVVDVVTALAETESAMETMVTVRDRVISAYEEIMRMPI